MAREPLVGDLQHVVSFGLAPSTRKHLGGLQLKATEELLLLINRHVAEVAGFTHGCGQRGKSVIGSPIGTKHRGQTREGANHLLGGTEPTLNLGGRSEMGCRLFQTR